MAAVGEPYALIGKIYEAATEADLWPSVLIELSETIGFEQVALPALDWRANVFHTIAPRLDPTLLTAYEDYWAFHDPVLAGAMQRKPGEICTVDKVMPRAEFRATPVYNEFWRLAGFGLDTIGANLLVEDQFATLICFSNSSGKDSVTSEQRKIFEFILPHLTRSLRIHRRLWDWECLEVIAEEGLESVPEAALLVDASARVISANQAARSMLDRGQPIFLEKGRLSAACYSETLQKAITSCTLKVPSLSVPGADFAIPQESPRAPILVKVTPLASKNRFRELPWIRPGIPVALVRLHDPETDRRQKEERLRNRFGFTYAETALVMEIMEGDGRLAAARRCGIKDATAKTHLANIFVKTGTRRQAELVRILLTDAAQELE